MPFHIDRLQCLIYRCHEVGDIVVFPDRILLNQDQDLGHHIRLRKGDIKNLTIALTTRIPIGL